MCRGRSTVRTNRIGGPSMSGSADSARRLVRALPIATVATLTTATTLAAAMPAHAAGGTTKPAASTMPGGFLQPATLNATMNWDRNVNPKPSGGDDGCATLFSQTLTAAQKQQLAAAGARLTVHAAPRGVPTNVDDTPELCDITV